MKDKLIHLTEILSQAEDFIVNHLEEDDSEGPLDDPREIGRLVTIEAIATYVHLALRTLKHAEDTKLF